MDDQAAWLLFSQFLGTHSSFLWCAGPGGRKVATNYDVAMEQLWGIPPPSDPCEECELRDELDEEQATIRQRWSVERAQLER